MTSFHNNQYFFCLLSSAGYLRLSSKVSCGRRCRPSTSATSTTSVYFLTRDLIYYIILIWFWCIVWVIYRCVYFKTVFDQSFYWFCSDLFVAWLLLTIWTAAVVCFKTDFFWTYYMCVYINIYSIVWVYKYLCGQEQSYFFILRSFAYCFHVRIVY